MILISIIKWVCIAYITLIVVLVAKDILFPPKPYEVPKEVLERLEL